MVVIKVVFGVTHAHRIVVLIITDSNHAAIILPTNVGPARFRLRGIAWGAIATRNAGADTGHELWVLEIEADCSLKVAARQLQEAARHIGAHSGNGDESRDVFVHGRHHSCHRARTTVCEFARLVRGRPQKHVWKTVRSDSWYGACRMGKGRDRSLGPDGVDKGRCL